MYPQALSRGQRKLPSVVRASDPQGNLLDILLLSIVKAPPEALPREYITEQKAGCHLSNASKETLEQEYKSSPYFNLKFPQRVMSHRQDISY